MIKANNMKYKIKKNKNLNRWFIRYMYIGPDWHVYAKTFKTLKEAQIEAKKFKKVIEEDFWKR